METRVKNLKIKRYVRTRRNIAVKKWQIKVYVGTHEKGWRQEFSFLLELWLLTVKMASVKQQLGYMR